VKKFDDMFSHLDRIPMCDGRMDRQTDGWTDILHQHIFTKTIILAFTHLYIFSLLVSCIYSSRFFLIITTTYTTRVMI